jgi:hypothetical protein
MNTIWGREGAYMTDETTPNFIARQRFIAKCTGEVVALEFDLILSGSELLNVADSVSNILNSPITGIHDECCFIEGDSVLAEISKKHSSNVPVHLNSPKGKKGSSLTVVLLGNRNTTVWIKNSILSEFGNQRISTIRWWYKGEHGGRETHSVFLPPIKTRLLPEFYPSITDPRAFIDDYLASEQSILLVAGDPGTGKTTLLRHMICDNNLTADVVYDEAIMDSDQVFQDFLFQSDSQVMIIEDADTILMAREDSQNKLMSRFLNIGDGLIKLPSKKLVFTTNISDFGRVDPALMRPGRCFDIIRTRTLTRAETRKAAEAAGLPIPSPHKDHYTLAEIFATRPVAEVRRIGFGG